MNTWKLWCKDTIIKEISGVQPLLASWEKSTHPAQQRLRAYLSELVGVIGLLPPEPAELFLHLNVDVQDSKRLLRHYDLENYLKPMFGRQWLDPSRFVLVSAAKSLGNGSSLVIGSVKSCENIEDGKWEHFSCNAGSGVETKKWKANLCSKLESSRPALLPEGAVQVRLAWRCAPSRNWTNLWKPTGDCMGPVLGEDFPQKPFNPRDDRINYLELHRIIDQSLGHSVEVGMWWRSGVELSLQTR